MVKNTIKVGEEHSVSNDKISLPPKPTTDTSILSLCFYADSHSSFSGKKGMACSDTNSG